MSSILFFSRGRGFGHALPDLAIARDLCSALPALDLSFVSYATGAAAIRRSGFHLIELPLPGERNPFLQTLLLASDVIRELAPRAIISHEEFAVPPVARQFRTPCLFLTDWFPTGDGNIWAECIEYADEILFIDHPMLATQPEALHGRVRHTGPVFRRLDALPETRDAARTGLGWSSERFVVLVIPSAAPIFTEARAPLMDLVIAAFDLIERKDKMLVWVAGEADYAAVAERFGARQDAMVVPAQDGIERLMWASDVAITKANRITTLELQVLGTPSVSISFGLNSVDDRRVMRIPTNRLLIAGSFSAQALKDCLMQMSGKAFTKTRVQIIEEASHGRVRTVKCLRDWLCAIDKTQAQAWCVRT